MFAHLIHTQDAAPIHVRAMGMETPQPPAPASMASGSSDTERETYRDESSPSCVDAPNGHATAVKQVLRYAEDIALIYSEEKKKRKALECANQKLMREVEARRRAERALKEAHQQLEIKVHERTTELCAANASLQREIAKRQLSEEQMGAALHEKEVLLAEIHHRVKNNLQIVSSLLGLQSDRLADTMVVSALNDSQSRIRSMALIHEQLYSSGNLARIRFSTYIEELVRNLIRTTGRESSGVTVDVAADDLSLGIGVAVPCALILNELLTNCFKHAFDPEGRGAIQVSFRCMNDEEGSYRLMVSDDGRGLPRDFDIRATRSLGLQLVRRLSEAQLRGKLEVQSTGGTSISVTFRDRQ